MDLLKSTTDDDSTTEKEKENKGEWV